MTLFELWFLIACASGFIVSIWLQRRNDRQREEKERNRRDYGRNL